MNAFECVGAQRILRPNELFIRNPLICLPKEPPTFLTTVGSPWIPPETGHRSFPVHHKNGENIPQKTATPTTNQIPRGAVWALSLASFHRVLVFVWSLIQT